jgi:hypothetical protein
MTVKKVASKEVSKYEIYSASLTRHQKFNVCFEIRVENREGESFMIRAIGDVFLFHRSDPSAGYARIFEDRKFVVTENPEKSKAFFRSTYTTPANALFSSLRAITTSVPGNNGTGVSNNGEDARNIENKRIIGLLRCMEDLMRKAGPIQSYMDDFN